MIMPMLKPLAQKITTALNKMSSERQGKVKFVVENHFQIGNDLVITYDDWKSLPENASSESNGNPKNDKLAGKTQADVQVVTVIRFMEVKNGVATSFKTIPFDKLLSEIG